MPSPFPDSPGSPRRHDPDLALSVLKEAAGDTYPEVVAHAGDVRALVTNLAGRLELPSSDLADLRDAALLHDIGKAGIPLRVLRKAGALDPDEWLLVRSHSERGAAVLQAIPELAHLAPVVRHVHERWDGRGYPQGLAGDAIPFASRVIAVCDAYVAMIELRPYARPRSSSEAALELAGGAGLQFDADLVRPLLELLGGAERAFGLT